VVIIGIAAPNGQMFGVMSAVPRDEERVANPGLASTLNSLRFGGQ
jgi:hypothetical protein